MQTIEQSREMAKLACEALADKKGEDIRVIDIAGISVLLSLQTEPTKAR